ncbi:MULTISPECIES: hypothetical protein [Bacillus]|uniref:hypothetical protein n=1 Tax=Bacillus TaxID=1386 RepID=UPI00042522B9|nr:MULTISPECIES: hypothetical protein [Bacillus]WFA04188.1 hypothetical protein P3X63_16360 [Bacillus sp. HSf4]
MKKVICFSAVMLVCLVGAGMAEGAAAGSGSFQSFGKSIFPDNKLNQSTLR